MKIPQLLCTLLALTAPVSALAQSDVDFDEGGDDRGAAKRDAKQRDLSAEVVREIERGVYLKTNLGTTVYFGNRSALLKPGTTIMFTLGMDVIDKPKASMAWEINFYQALHNSTFPDYTFLAGSGVPPQFYTQGDIHTFGVFAGLEGSAYPLRRLGIGGHAGGGIAFVPLLLDRGANGETYARVLQDLGVTALPLHERSHAAIYVGPTFEYYTKLSHFSLGLDVDFLYIFGLDLGMMATGYLKYSF